MHARSRFVLEPRRSPQSNRAMFDLSSIRWAPILTMVVASFVLGGVWYGPLFGKAWLSALGKNASDLRRPVLPFIVSIASGFVTSVVMALFVDEIGARTLIDGAVTGFAAGFGLVAMSTASDMAFCRFSARLWAIQSAYRVVLFVAMGATFAIWR